MAGITRLRGSKLFIVRNVTITDNTTVSHNGGTYTSPKEISAVADYKPVAIASVAVENATNGGQYAQLCYIYTSEVVDDTHIRVRVRNIHASLDAKVRIVANVLYVRSDTI